MNFNPGFVDPDAKSELFKVGVKEFILKPYSRGEILTKVRELLDLRIEQTYKKANGVLA